MTKQEMITRLTNDQENLDRLILRTSTGEERNNLTAANIYVMKAIEVLKTGRLS